MAEFAAHSVAFFGLSAEHVVDKSLLKTSLTQGLLSAGLRAREFKNRGKKVDPALAIDPFVPQPAGQPKASLKIQLHEFFGILVPASRHDALLAQFDNEAIFDGLNDADDIDRQIGAVLATLNAADLHEYGVLTASEPCDMFQTARLLDNASASSCLPPSISELEVERFSTWASTNEIEHRYSLAGHLEIIRTPLLIEEIAALVRRLD